MKKQTKLLLLGFIAILCIGLNSCSTDDDPKEHPEDTVGRRLVSKLECTSDDGEYTVSFSYTKDGKIEKIMSDNQDVLKEVIYNKTGNKLLVQSDYGEEGKKTISFILNDAGNVASYSNTVTYEYESGCLKQAFNGTYSSDKYIWSNGDIKEYQTDYTSLATTVICTYYEQENKMNLDPLDNTGITESLSYSSIYCLSSGYFGKINTHLLKEVKAVNWSYEFSYDFDEEGYVRRMVMVEYDKGLTPFTSTARVTYIK